MNGLASINIELTNRCNKQCWICGRRKREAKGAVYNRDIHWDMLCDIAKQVPNNITVQLHNNGEPLLYPKFKDAVILFSHCYTNIVTNGKLLVEKANEIIGNLDTLSVSMFEDDDEADEQEEILTEFLRLKGARKPFVTARLIGNVDNDLAVTLGLPIVRRVLHAPQRSTHYLKHDPPIPETGVCWDLLTRLAIDTKGDVSVCVRHDPERKLVLGNLREWSLEELWECEKRRLMILMHLRGERSTVPYCGNQCDYYGIPNAP